MIAFSDAEAQNKRLLRELKQKEATIEELYQQLHELEKRLEEFTGGDSKDKIGIFLHLLLRGLQ